jgi:hypothetical protein
MVQALQANGVIDIRGRAAGRRPDPDGRHGRRSYAESDAVPRRSRRGRLALPHEPTGPGTPTAATYVVCSGTMSSNLAGVFAYVRTRDMDGRPRCLPQGRSRRSDLRPVRALVIIRTSSSPRRAGSDVFEAVATSRRRSSTVCSRPWSAAPWTCSCPLVGGEDGITTTRYYLNPFSQDCDRVSLMLTPWAAIAWS